MKIHYMKNLFLILLPVILLTSSGTMAQESRPEQPRTPEERAKATVDYLSKNMNLSKEKHNAMTPIFVTFYKDMNNARSAGSKDDMDKAEKKLETSLRKILKEPEVKEVKRLLEERKKQRGQYIRQQHQTSRQPSGKN